MKITDPIIWQSFALHVSQNADKYDLRNLSTVVYALSKISQFKPVELNFDGLLGSLEVSFIVKLDQETSQDSQSL